MLKMEMLKEYSVILVTSFYDMNQKAYFQNFSQSQFRIASYV